MNSSSQKKRRRREERRSANERWDLEFWGDLGSDLRGIMFCRYGDLLRFSLRYEEIWGVRGVYLMM